MNKKGGLELVSQTVLWIPKILLLILAAFVILAPINCYIHRSVEDGSAESFIVLKKAVYCLEKKGFEQEKLANCMKQDRYGIRISNENQEIIFNEKKYLEKTFCNLEGWFCRNETRKIDNKEFLVEVIVKNE